MTFEFNGKKYKKVSTHQKEWGNKIISEFKFRGNEHILDLGCGDGTLTNQPSMTIINWSISFPFRNLKYGVKMLTGISLIKTP